MGCVEDRYLVEEARLVPCGEGVVQRGVGRGRGSPPKLGYVGPNGRIPERVDEGLIVEAFREDPLLVPPRMGRQPGLPLLDDGQPGVGIRDEVHHLRCRSGVGAKQLIQRTRVVRRGLRDDDDLRGVDGSGQGCKLRLEVVGQADTVGVVNRHDSCVPERAVRVQVAPGNGAL